MTEIDVPTFHAPVFILRISPIWGESVCWVAPDCKESMWTGASERPVAASWAEDSDFHSVADLQIGRIRRDVTSRQTARAGQACRFTAAGDLPTTSNGSGTPRPGVSAGDDTAIPGEAIVGLILGDFEVFKKHPETRPDAVPASCSTWRKWGKPGLQPAMEIRRPVIWPVAAHQQPRGLLRATECHRENASHHGLTGPGLEVRGSCSRSRTREYRATSRRAGQSMMAGDPMRPRWGAGATVSCFHS